MTIKTVSRIDLTKLLSPFLEKEETDKIPLVAAAFKKAITARENREKDQEQAKIAYHRSLLAGISKFGLGPEARKTVFLLQDNTAKEVQLIEVIGFGANKIAVHISGDKVLMLPNGDHRYLSTQHIDDWKKIVDEEIEISNLFQSRGLMTSAPKKVQVSLSPQASNGALSTLVAETFQSLAKCKNLFVLEPDRDSSIWKKGVNFLFATPEERMQAENWDSVLEPLLTDIARIALYDLPAISDSCNLAVHKKPEDHTSASPYEVRYFGFDFHYAKSMLKAKRANDSPLEERVDSYLHIFLHTVFKHEFPMTYSQNRVMGLRYRLCVKYAPIITKRIKEIFEAANICTRQ